MKTSLPLLLCFVLFHTVNLYAQAPDHSALCREKMKKLELFSGRWEGKAIYRQGPGRTDTIHQQERIEWKLNGAVLMIEGIGTKPHTAAGKGELVFNAIALINYNPLTNEYNFKSYLKEGTSTDAYFLPEPDNTFTWGFDMPNKGKVKYHITLDPAKKTWHEEGAFSMDGNTWHDFIELNLKKIE